MIPPLRLRLTLAYDGSGFRGWQRQDPPDGPPLRTVQGELEAALGRLLNQPTPVKGASRTDAGVHALGQVVAFNAPARGLRVPLDRLAHALTCRLPDDIQVVDAAEAPPGFNPASEAVSKRYRYRLWTASQRPLTLRHVVHHCWTPLDESGMQDAAARLVGRHDFAGFASARHGRESTVRTVHRCEVWPGGASHPEELHIVVEGDGFLYNMVRIIAGTLVEVGRRRFPPEQVDAALATADRTLAGPTLPPGGLCLEWIRYGHGFVVG